MQSHLDERDINTCRALARPQEAPSASPPAGLFRNRPRLGVAMEPTAATKFTGRLPLLFLLLRLLRGITAAQSGLVVAVTPGEQRKVNALSLSYNFSITSQAGPGQSWCEIQVQVNGNKFLSYDCQTKEFKPIGPWGMKLKDTAFWQKQEETVKLLVEELRKKLLDIKAENFTKSGSLTMQGRLMCERGADGHARESWQLDFNEQITPLFELENRKWTVDHSGGQQVKDMLDGDRELTEPLMKITNGDCQSWLQQVWEHWDETQKTTVPPTTRQDMAQTRNIWIFIMSSIIASLIVLIIICIIIIKNQHSV
ncbi:NKG2D ligand 3-like [Enhydra lutris kenyoni]|uniref:NKG2D ligand 3-like n=1 Tax=Enhydra lutris kenyoni TaxID=391180 RepID=A0A2Y9JPX0_ENHLU|nr:NKG2D ligand 3-like [Enhydra lutris kenyoni]